MFSNAMCTFKVFEQSSFHERDRASLLACVPYVPQTKRYIARRITQSDMHCQSSQVPNVDLG